MSSIEVHAPLSDLLGLEFWARRQPLTGKIARAPRRLGVVRSALFSLITEAAFQPIARSYASLENTPRPVGPASSSHTSGMKNSTTTCCS
jgi:hypothetical protein